MNVKYYGTNMEYIRRLARELHSHEQEKSGLKPKTTWYQWKENNLLRLLPPWSDECSPFRIIYKHIEKDDKRRLLCLKRSDFRETCFLCIANDRIQRDNTKYRYTYMGRAYANCIDRENLNSDVNLVALPISVFDRIIELMMDPDVGDITHLQHGSDVHVVRNKFGSNQLDVSYATEIVNRQSPLSKDGASERKWLQNLNDIDKIFKQPDHETIQKNLGQANDLLFEHGLPPIDPFDLSSRDKQVGSCKSSVIGRQSAEDKSSQREIR